MLQVFIPSYKCIELNGSTGKAYHVYTVQINNGSRIYTIERRYSDFLQLHKELRKQYETPEFPPKRVRNNRSIVLESRRLALQTYLQIMIQLNPIPREIFSFLNLHQYQQSRLPGMFHSAHYEDQSSAVPGGSNGSNGFNHDDSSDDYQKLWATSAFLTPAASFVEDPYLLESDSSSSNLSDCVTRGVLDALYYQTDI